MAKADKRARKRATKGEVQAKKALRRGRREELPEDLRTGDPELDGVLARVRGMGRDAAVALLVANGWPVPVAKAFVTLTVKYYDSIGRVGRWALAATLGKAKKAGGRTKLRAPSPRSRARKKKNSNSRARPSWWR